jgi:hypothetical protein
MVWTLESTLSAISNRERERSLTLEERLLLLMQHGAPSRPPVELLKYQAEHGHRDGRNTVHR